MDVSFNNLVPAERRPENLPDQVAEVKARSISLPELAESLNRENPLKIYGLIDDALDLSPNGRDFLGQFNQLTGPERDAFLKELTTLLDQGVVGYESLEVRGERRTSFVSTRLGDPELRNAAAYRERSGEAPGSRLLALA